MTNDEWAEQTCPELREAIRSILAIHVENRVDVPTILRLVLLSVREHYGESYVTGYTAS